MRLCEIKEADTLGGKLARIYENIRVLLHLLSSSSHRHGLLPLYCLAVLVDWARATLAAFWSRLRMASSMSVASL